MPIIRWLLLICFIAFLSRHREHPQKEFNGPDHGAEPANWKQPERPSGEAPQQGWHPQEEKHRRREWRYWCFSILLSVAVAVGAGLSAFYAYKAVEAGQAQAQAARDQTYIAENALVAANRPWIKVTGLEISRIEVKTDSVIVAANIGVKNVGASPAVGGDENPRLSGADAHSRPSGGRRRRCCLDDGGTSVTCLGVPARGENSGLLRT